MTQKETKQMTLEYIKTRFKYHTIATLLDIPILILLYWLNYYTAFTILLILMILSEIGYASEIIKLVKKLGL